MRNLITIEVAYALPDRQKLIRLQVAPDTSPLQAIRESGMLELFPEIDLANSKIGIFGKVVPKPDAVDLREGDRIEIYRPLKIDPKQARLNRAKKAAK